MANLIITIISIALVAVAALMGAYYGGSAFLNGQAKANANAAVAQGEQQVAAWSVYTADRSGTWTLSSISALSATTPTAYLTTLPLSPAGITNAASPPTGANQTISTAGGWNLVNLSDISSGTSTNYDAVFFRLTDDQAGVNTCNNVATMIGGSAAVPTQTSVSNNLLSGGFSTDGRKFDCVYYTSVSTSTSAAPSAAANLKYIYYRAY